MTMKALLGFAVLVLMGAGIYVMAIRDTAPQDKAVVESYFTEKFREKALAYKASHPDELFAGYAGGVSGFLLRKAFPGLVPSDFTGVHGKDESGDYFEKDGELYFMGHGASDSADISPKGMVRILENASKRLSLPITRKDEIDALLKEISN